MSYNDGAYVLLDAVAANTTGSGLDWFGGEGVFEAYGTFGGGTCKLQYSPDGGTTWIDVDRSGDDFVTFTANGIGGFDLPAGKIRAVLAGATTPALSAHAKHTGK